MHLCSAGLSVLDRAREMEGEGDRWIEGQWEGKNVQLSCVTKTSSIVWGSLGIPSSKYRRQIILQHAYKHASVRTVHVLTHMHMQKQICKCTPTYDGYSVRSTELYVYNEKCLEMSMEQRI